MREKSIYEFACVCGKRIESEAPEGVHQCGTAWRLEWPAKPGEQIEQKGGLS